MADELVKSARREYNARDKIAEILKKLDRQTLVLVCADSSYLLNLVQNAPITMSKCCNIRSLTTAVRLPAVK